MARKYNSETGSTFTKVVVYFGLLLDKSKLGVAESEKLVAAIFLLAVWPFLPYFGLHCPGIAHRRLEMLSIRTSGAQKSKSWPESTTEKPEVLSKVPEMVRNAVKFIFIRKMREKSRRRQNRK